MPSTSPACASATAFSIALPESVPARVSPEPGHVPMDSSTSRPAPVEPTRTYVAAPRTARSASAARMISGPMPRGSPSVTASRGSMVIVARSGPVEDRRGGGGATRLDLDVHRLALRVDVPAHLRDLLEIRADALLHFVVGVLTRFVVRHDLRDDELLKAVRRRNREDDDRILARALEARLIARRQRVARHLRHEARRIFGRIVEVLRDGVEDRALAERGDEAVGELFGDLHVGRIHLGNDEDLPHLHF